MPPPVVEEPMRFALPLMVAAAVMIYVASRAMVDALLQGRLPAASPGRRALGHWMPIAMTAGFATLMRRPEIAIGVLFASSVAALSLVQGVVTYISPAAPPHTETPNEPAKAVGRYRLWPFVLPAALLALLAGFSGGLNLHHAAFFIVLGLILLGLWSEESRRAGQNPMLFDPDAAPATSLSAMRLAQILLALTVAALGAWAAGRGTVDLAASTGRVSTALITATLLGPILVFPMISPAVALARRGQWQIATTMQVGVVLLNLCLLLPAVVAGWYLLAVLASLGHIDNASAYTTPLPFPVAAWRIDTVVLIVLGLLLLPLAIGRWTLSRIEGIGLIVVYGIYLVLSVQLGTR